MARLKLPKGHEDIRSDLGTIIIVNDITSFTSGKALLNDYYNFMFYNRDNVKSYDWTRATENKNVILFLENEGSEDEADFIKSACTKAVGETHIIKHMKRRKPNFTLHTLITIEKNNINALVDFIDNNRKLVNGSKNEQIKENSKNRKFACLGYNGDVYYFYKKGNQTIVGIKSMSIDAKFIKTLESPEYWEENYLSQVPHKNHIYTYIANDLRGECEMLGTYSEDDRNRSVGFWRDGADFVYHDGEQVLSSIRGKRDLFDYTMDSDNKKVYISSSKLNLNLGSEINDNETRVIEDYINAFRWKNPDYAKVAIGWSVVSPLGGLLEWRPNLWIKGSSGAGKTTVGNALKNLSMVDGRFKFEGGTTEAGLRNRISGTSFGVFIDEFESANKKGAQNKQDIALLVRLSTSGGTIVQGVATFGGASTFSIRNCFCMMSIGVGLEEKADLNRFSILELDPDAKTVSKEEFDRRERNFYQMVDPRNITMGDFYNKEYCEFSPLRNRFISKTFKHLNVLLKVTYLAKNSLAKMTEDIRFADKFSSIVAGYAIFKDVDLNHKTIDGFIEEHFSSILEELEEDKKHVDSDFQKRFLSDKVIFAKEDGRFATEGSVYELIKTNIIEENRFNKKKKDAPTTRASYFLRELRNTLMRRGIKITDDNITLNLENDYLTKNLYMDKDTAEDEFKNFIESYAKDYNKKNPDNQKVKRDFLKLEVKKFAGMKVKTARFPINILVEDDEDEE